MENAGEILERLLFYLDREDALLKRMDIEGDDGAHEPEYSEKRRAVELFTNELNAYIDKRIQLALVARQVPA